MNLPEFTHIDYDVGWLMNANEFREQKQMVPISILLHSQTKIPRKRFSWRWKNFNTYFCMLLNCQINENGQCLPLKSLILI